MSSTTSDSEPSGSYKDPSESGTQSSSSDTSDAGTDGQAGQSGSSNSDHSEKCDEVQTSTGQDEGFAAVFRLMKSNSQLWQQFGLLASQLGMTADLFEKYLCTIVKNLATNPDVKAQLSAQTGGQTDSNPELMNQLLAVAAMQQAMNPLLIAQFLAQNCQNPQALLGQLAAQLTGQKDEVQEERPEYSPGPISLSRSWASATMTRLRQIRNWEIPLCPELHDVRKTWDINELFDAYERAHGNHRYIDVVGNLGYSEQELINIACWPPYFSKDKDLEGIEWLDKLRNILKSAKYTRKALGVFPRSLNKFVLAKSKQNRRVILPCATEQDPIYGTIKLREIQRSCGAEVVFLEGSDPFLKSKPGRMSVLLNVLGRIDHRNASSYFMFISRVKFMDPVFPLERFWRSSELMWGGLFGPVYFVSCTFEKTVMLHSDTWLFDCKGPELNLLDYVCAHCVRCDFGMVRVLRGYIVAQECHFGTLQLGEDSATSEEPLKTYLYRGRFSHFCLDRCVVDKSERIEDRPNIEMRKIHGVTQWEYNYADVKRDIEKFFMKRGWTGVSQVERYTLRTLKICSSCLHDQRCVFCRCPVSHSDKTISLCQFCAPDLEHGVHMWRMCTLCRQETELVAHARVCKRCGKEVYPHYCMHCGAMHGQEVEWGPFEADS